MLKDPFGHEWKGEQFNRALRLRLGQSYSSIESGIENLKKLVDELVIKLGLGSDLKVREIHQRNLRSFSIISNRGLDATTL